MTPPIGRMWRRTKDPLDESEEESEKVDLKLNNQKTNIMASGPITSWQIDGKQWEQWEILFWGVPKWLKMVIAAIKLKDTPWKKSYDQPTHRIVKQDITLPTEICLVKAMFFPVVMYGCESWTLKKPEHWRIDAFELWCWIRLLRVSWTARISKQSILREISPEYSLEELMLKLKLQYLTTWSEKLNHWKRPWC